MIICGIQIGSIVISTAGRDKGNYFIVTKIEDNYVYLIDGNIRKIENPKKKKIKHIEMTIYQSDLIAEKLINKNKLNNQDIKRALKEATKE